MRSRTRCANRPLLLLYSSCLAMASGVIAQPATQTQPTKEQLKIWLRQYPAADADQDGVLTVPEAEAYRRRLVQQRRKQEGTPDDEFATEFAFATMSDGVDIALAIGFPRGFDPQDTRAQVAGASSK